MSTDRTFAMYLLSETSAGVLVRQLFATLNEADAARVVEASSGAVYAIGLEKTVDGKLAEYVAFGSPAARKLIVAHNWDAPADA